MFTVGECGLGTGAKRWHDAELNEPLHITPTSALPPNAQQINSLFPLIIALSLNASRLVKPHPNRQTLDITHTSIQHCDLTRNSDSLHFNFIYFIYTNHDNSRLKL